MIFLLKKSRRTLRMAVLVLSIATALHISTTTTQGNLEELDLPDPYALPISAQTTNSTPVLLKGGTIVAYGDKKKEFDIIRGGDILIVNDRINTDRKIYHEVPLWH